jgi:hypothetical protein
MLSPVRNIKHKDLFLNSYGAIAVSHHSVCAYVQKDINIFKWKPADQQFSSSGLTYILFPLGTIFLKASNTHIDETVLNT